MTQRLYFTRDDLKSSTSVIDEDGNRLNMQVLWTSLDSGSSYLDDSHRGTGLPECRLARSPQKLKVEFDSGKYFISEDGKPLRPAEG